MGKADSSRKGGIKASPASDGTTLDALRLAFAAARERHRQAGVPMVFYENGKVVEIDAAKVRLPRK